MEITESKKVSQVIVQYNSMDLEFALFGIWEIFIYKNQNIWSNIWSVKLSLEHEMIKAQKNF